MDKREYFVKAVAAGAYRYKRWVIEAFSITDTTDQAMGTHPYALFRDPEHGYGFINPQTGEPEFLEGVRRDHAPFAFMETMTAYPNDLPNLSQGVETTYGQFFVNAYVLCHAFGNRIPYLNGEITAKKLEQELLKRYVNDPPAGQERDPDKIYTDMYLEFGKACTALEGFSALCVVSATPKTMTCDPRIAVRRQELLEQYRDRLHDPVIQVRIESELKKIDREWMRGDPGERFYLKSKSYDVVRKKMFLLQGASEGLGATGDYITRPLSDGWTGEDLPAMINNLRDGTYSRGAQTALGGEITKFLYRIFQNTSITEEDCGSTMGLEIVLNEQIANRFVGSSILRGQSLVEITEDNWREFIDRKVRLRYPTYCKTSGANFCATCMGKHISRSPNALSSYVAAVGSMFMQLFMSAMHGKTLQVRELDFMESLS